MTKAGMTGKFKEKTACPECGAELESARAGSLWETVIIKKCVKCGYAKETRVEGPTVMPRDG